MYDNALKTVKAMGSPKVLLVGDFMLDVYIYGDAERISPEAPVPVLKIVEKRQSCGGAGNVAMNLSALEAKCICIGIIGDDEPGKAVIEKLNQAGADTTGLLTVNDRPTITKTRLVGRAQHRHQQQLFRMDEESTTPLSPQQIQQVLELYSEKLAEADIVCLQDYNKGLLNKPLCQKMIEAACAADKKILVDPSPTSDYAKYAGATVITPNRQETSFAAGFEIVTVEDAAKASHELLGDLELEAVIVTLDKEGVYLRSEQADELLPTRPRNIYDVTGAGDTVLATLAVALAAGSDYKTAAQLCNITGGLEVEKFGAATVTRDEIINEILAMNRGKSGKVYQFKSLANILQEHRLQKQTVVWTNGCFDVIHRGHIEYLKFCKQQGDIVVVGLNSDSSVRAIKGPGRPIHNEIDRAAVLAALENVDFITIFEEPDPLKVIEQVRPDIIVKGEDWKNKGVIGQQFVESYGGKVIFAPLVDGKSSTSIIEKMKTLFKKSKTTEQNA